MKNGYRFGLIGYRVSYSKSKDVFRAIFSFKGKEGTFDVFDVAPGNFHGCLDSLSINDIKGLSVTIPYKQAVIQYLHEVDTIAKALEAVNSIAINSGRLCGFNTDCYGFSLPLRKCGEWLKRGSALIMGCGGAAKAAVYSLYTDFEVRRFTVVGRKKDKLAQFSQSLQCHLPLLSVTTVIDREASSRNWKGEIFDIIVNCTPLGGWNHPDECPLPEGLSWQVGKLYYDVNYNLGNKLVKRAEEAGLEAVDGSAMLVGQALRSFSIWTGETVPFEPIYDEVFGRCSDV